MFIEPAVNVWVPPTDVILTLSNAPDKVTFPPNTVDLAVEPIAMLPEQTQVLPDILVSIITPYNNAEDELL